MKSKIGIILTWLFLLLTLGLFLLSKQVSSEGIQISWLFISQLFSLSGATLLSISFILSSRWSFIEDWFGGLDKVYKRHHLFGGISFVLLLHHPLFLILNILPDVQFSWKYVWLSDQLPYNWGVLSLYSMILMLVLTLLINLPYSLWKKTHEFMGLALFFAFFHILTISSDVSRFLPLRFWLITLMIIALYSVIFRRFLYPVIGPKFQYMVKEVLRLGDIYILDLLPLGRKLKFNPGQFIFTRLEDISGESHPFSITNSSSQDSLRIVVKVLGDYTWKLGSLKPGSSATLWGPYGKFGEAAMRGGDLIWIAGGIGITPFLSLLDYELENPQSRKIDLFYCVGMESEAVFDQEIKDKFCRVPNMTYCKYLSDVSGRINIEKIIELCGGVENKKIMICGPVSLMESLASQLRKIGIKNHNIIFEDFYLK